MGTAAKATRENRTITVDFRDEAIDVQVCFRNLRSLLQCEIALFTVKPKKI